MPLVRNGAVASDDYVRIADGAPVPDCVAAIVSADRLLSDTDEIARRGGALGVVWPNRRDPAELAPYLGTVDLIALEFPSFRDGRAYSQARILRERFRFGGELRATGKVLRDQFLFMLRAGFDSFEVAKESDARAFADSISRYSVFYQPAAAGTPAAPRVRLSRAQPAAAVLGELQQQS